MTNRAAVAALCLVQFVDVLGVTVVITALPSMLHDLGSSASSATPIVTGYAMFFGGLLMLGARLGDRYGHRRVLVAGLAVFAVGSLAGALAGSITWLVVARCVQGAAAAGSVPSALRLLSALATDEDERRHALAAWSASGAAAGACGLILGGVLTDVAGWRLLFWLNLPLAAVLVAAVLRSAPALPATRHKRLDLFGAAVLTVAVMGLVLGCALLEQSDQVGTGLALIGAGLVLSIVFSIVERRGGDPLLPGTAVRNPQLRVGAIVSALNTASTSSAITLATLYLQDTRDVNPATAGVALLPFSVLVVVAAGIVSARLMRRVGPSNAAGIGLGLIAVADLVLLGSSTAVWLLVAAVGLAGFGLGLSSVAATTIGTDVPDPLAGTAAGVLNTAAQLGTALGVAVVVLVASSTDDLAFGGAPLGWTCAAVLAAAGAAALVGRRRVDEGAELATSH